MFYRSFDKACPYHSEDSVLDWETVISDIGRIKCMQ